MKRPAKVGLVSGLGAVAALASASAALAGFSLTTSATPSFSTSLNGTDRTPTYTAALTVDNSGVGVSVTGWNLTITSTQYSAAGGRTLASDASTITAVAVGCASSCTIDPSNAVTYPVAVPAGSGPPTAVKFFNAATATGLGTFTVTPTVRVPVPANAFAGTYTTTLTLALAAGP